MSDLQRKGPENLAVSGAFLWWAWQGLNLRPLRCQHSDIALNAQKSARKLGAVTGTPREQTPIRGRFYRSFTAAIGRAA